MPNKSPFCKREREKEIDSGMRVEYHDFWWPASGHGQIAGLRSNFEASGLN